MLTTILCFRSELSERRSYDYLLNNGKLADVALIFIVVSEEKIKKTATIKLKIRGDIASTK